jgi:alkylation response protein AidB-like acyl-CoA dehydrogenase
MSKDADALKDVVGMAQSFASRALDAEYLQRCERDGAFPEDAWAALVQSDLLSVHSQDFDSTIRWRAMVQIVRILTHKSIAIANSYVASGTALMLFELLADAAGVGAIREAVIRGDRFAFGFTEPGGGQDLIGALETRIRNQPNGLTLSGSKIFTTGAAEATRIMVLALDTRRGAANNVSLAIVKPGMPGVGIRRLPMISFRSLPTYEVTFESVLLTEDAILGGANAWPRIVQGMCYERLNTAAMALGLAGAAFDLSMSYSKSRTAFGRPIGQLQAIQHSLADSYVDLQQARLMCEDAARIADAGSDLALATTAAKLSATEACVRIVERGMRLMGGHGIAEEHDMQRFFRDIRPLLIGPITNEMAKNIIGQSLGLPRSY